MDIPKGFLVGATTASYQVEGGWNEDGKGENIWDRLTHTRPELIKNRDNGDVACDSYHKIEQDVELLKDIGFHIYRFSISWSRLMPHGDVTTINQKGVDYYNRLIDSLIEKGIQPMVTMYHWDLPQKLQDLGGWTNSVIADYFEDYARFLFQEFGDRVKWWITINEPIEVIKGYSSMAYAPALNLESPADYLVGHTMLLAHAKAYRLYDATFRQQQKGKISITLASCCYEPKTNTTEDFSAAERAFIFNLDWFAHPIYSERGDYPEQMKKIVEENSIKEGRHRSRLPAFTAEQILNLKGAYDYFAINHYTTHLCSPAHSTKFVDYVHDTNVIQTDDPKWPTSYAPWLKVVPWGFKKLLLRIKEVYQNPPVFITENGYCDSGQLDDYDRINYHKSYMTQMFEAVNAGCNVIGYLVWSLLDNFEWLDGYSYRFGVVNVDFDHPDRIRTMKKSAEFFKECLEKNSLD